MALSTDTQAAAAQETEDGTLVGRNAESKVGFYGATPVARAELPASATVDDVIAALVAAGLVTQAA